MGPLIKRNLAIFVLAIYGEGAAAKSSSRGCGSGPGKREEVLLLAERNRQMRPAAKATALRRAATMGDLVIMEAADGIVSERNLFNLDRRRIGFTPSSGTTAYRYETGDEGFVEPAANDRALTNLEDDDAADAALPFSFPYFGQRYERVWINSDGNLTFDRPDTASSDRSLGRMTSGPPRLAALFTDLDPSRAGSVIVSESSERFTVTWQRVPEYRASGVGSPNTFQVTLFPDGRVEFHFRGVTAPDAVVGIARGRLEGAASVVSFLNSPSPSGSFTSTIAERFSVEREIDMVTLAQRFYQQFDDAYDYLTVYNNMGIAAGASAVAFEVTVRNERLGYGDTERDDGALYGSARRLQAVMNMGPLAQYPVDPNGLVPARAGSRDTPLSILGHEAGHLFLAFASVRDAANAAARPMLGIQNAHWTFGFNSEASLLEGNRIRDLGPDVTPRFETVGSSEGYAPLDQYLMGLRAAAEVPPSFLVESASLSFFPRPPQTGVRFDGRRREVTVEEIVAAEGRRTPDHTVAQRRFRFAFILLVTPGTEPTPEQVQQVERYRAEFGPYYARVTEGRGVAETTLREALSFSAQPAAGVLAGGTAELRMETQRPGPWEIRLSAAPAGLLTVPESVTIPAGATSTVVRVTGMNPGVAELVAETLEGRHETARTRVQVASRGALRAWVSGGDRQVMTGGRPLEPIVVRASDENRVPYPGIAIRGTAVGGSLEAEELVTNARGEAAFRFRPGAGPVNEVSFRVMGGGTEGARAVILSRPAVADGGVVNAASYSPGLSPGALVTMFGANLTAAREPERLAFPGGISLGGTQVTVGDRVARLLYVSDYQVNFVMPATLEPGVYEVEVRGTTGISERKPVSVEEAWPGLFSASAGSEGLIRVVATGLGLRATVEAEVAGGAAEVVGVRNLPGGESEVTVRMPGQRSGPVMVRLSAGGRWSNAVSVAF